MTMSVAVVIPVYNGASSIRKTLDSVLGQTRPADEIIVVDDGSSDGTSEIVREYPARLIQQANGGPSAARNHGVAEASSEWIAFLDADDSWKKDKLKSHEEAVRGHSDAIVTYTDFTVYQPNGNTVARSVCGPNGLAGLVRFRCPFPPSVAVVRRDIFAAVSGFDLSLRGPEDWDLWFRIYQRYGANGFVRIPAALTDYFVSPGSMGRNVARQLEQYTALVERRFLDGLSGMERWTSRRRLFAKLHRDASIVYREDGGGSPLGHMLHSLAYWPFYDRVQADRHKIALNMALKSLLADLQGLAQKPMGFRSARARMKPT
jgi:glycosyltransferase involved in cell wall biosynthesis